MKNLFPFFFLLLFSCDQHQDNLIGDPWEVISYYTADQNTQGSGLNQKEPPTSTWHFINKKTVSIDGQVIPYTYHKKRLSLEFPDKTTKAELTESTPNGFRLIITRDDYKEYYSFRRR
jgi:hypothetical protein